jgi:FlaA1/EpsC-like NDP-sugar epimerase
LQFAAFLSDVAAAPGESGLSRRTNLLIETLVDGALTIASFYAAYVVVVEGDGIPYQRHIFIWSLPAVLVARYLALFAFGLYRRTKSDAKRGTLVRIAAAVVVSELAAYLFVTNTQTLSTFPAKIFAVDAVICFILLSVGRFAERAGLRVFRTWRDRGGRTVAAS